MKQRLFTPGPTPVPERVMLAMAQPIIHHRNKEFEDLFSEVNDGLQYLYQTAQPVLTFASSGTGAMEAAFVNCHSHGDTILNLECGKFGERWTALPKAYGLEVDVLRLPWGLSPDPDGVKEFLKKKPTVRSVVMTHSETSTGAFTDVQAMARVVREHSDALVIVDGVTSVGAMELRFDDWGLDVVVTGSQKGLMLPPGLGICAVSKRAQNAAAASNLPRFYFDFNRAIEDWRKGTTPFTPAVSLIIGLREALRMMREEGLENVWRRHAMMAEGCRRAMRALGLELLARQPANAVTAVKVPAGIDGEELFKKLRSRFGMTLAGGQDNLKGRIFRVSHLGYYDAFDMLAVLAGIERVLSEFGYRFEPGLGVKTFQTYAMESHV